MKYPLAAAAAKTENFDALNEGIWITEAALDNMEASFAGHAAAVDNLNTQLTAAQAAQATAETSLATANTTLQERDVRIAQLETELAAANRNPANEFQEAGREADDLGGNNVASHDDPANPFNQFADKFLVNTKK